MQIRLTDKYKPIPKQQEASDCLARYIFYGGAMRGGKQLSLDAEIATPGGMKTHRDIAVGDEVCNPDGSISVVVKLHDITESDEYILHLANGVDITANADHLWYGGWRRDKKDFTASWDNEYCVKTTKQVKEYLEKTTCRNEKFRIPLPEAIDFDDQHVPLDPYLLGMLLGDGCLTDTLHDDGSRQPIKITTEDIDPVRKHTDSLGIPTVVWGQYAGGKKCADVVLKGDHGKEIKKVLDLLGLLGTRSKTKFIPECYKINTKEVRLAIFQGLMDTDGCVDVGRSSSRFFSTSKRLAEDLAFIARSLGYYACVTERSARIREAYTDYKGDIAGPYECSPSYIVYVAAMQPAEFFRLERKKARCGERIKPLTVSVDSVEATGRKIEMRCITVAHPNGLYITNGFTPTHNSVWLVMELLRLLLKYPGNVGLLCRWELSSLKRTTLITLLMFWPEAVIQRHHKGDGVIELPNGSVLYYMGLRPSSTNNALDRLKSLEIGCFGMDESTEVQKQYFDLLKTRLSLRLPDGSFPMYRGCLTGNPEPGWVAETFVEQEKSNHKFIPALPRENPHIPPDYIQNQKEDLPDELYEQYIEGSWDVLMRMGQYVFPYPLVKAAMEAQLEPKGRREAGVDIARFGGDENVAAIRQGPVVDIPYTSRLQDTNTTTSDLAKFIEEEEPEETKIDSVGVGGGVFDNLKAMGYNVKEVIGGASPRDKDRFVNARAENHWGLRKRMEEYNLDLPNDSKLRAQFVGTKYKIRTDRRILIESKEDLKKRGVESPDQMEAIINAFSEGTQPNSAVHFW